MPTVTATAETIQDKAAGKFVCDFVSRLPTTDSGQPFQLYEWQRVHHGLLRHHGG